MTPDDFIAAIIANPHEDAARLVFADYLEEQGDPRGELIRLQFQLADIDKWDPKRRKLRSRELKLLRQYGHFGSVPTFVKVIGTRGGFIDKVEVSVAKFLKLQDEIFANSPVRSVVLRYTSAKFDDLQKSEHLEQLSSLKLLNTRARESQLEGLFACGRLRNLRSLLIDESELPQQIGRLIANQPSFRKLESLSLIRHNHGVGKFIAGSSELTSLRSLTLASEYDDSLQAFAEAPNLRQLKTLHVSGVFGQHAIRKLQSGTSCRELEDLMIRSRSLPDPDVFNVDDPLPNLSRLSYGGRCPSNVLMELCQHYPHLRQLDLSSNRIRDDGIEALCESDLLENLVELNLRRNRIGHLGVDQLARAKKRRKRTKIHLAYNPISRRKVRALKEKYGKTFGNLGADSRYSVFRLP